MTRFFVASGRTPAPHSAATGRLARGWLVGLLGGGAALCASLAQAQLATPSLPQGLVAPLMLSPHPLHPRPPALPGGMAPAAQPATASAATTDAATATDTAAPGPGVGDVPSRWVLGMTVVSSPSFNGGSRELSGRPVLAGKVGRWMLATSTARGLAGPELVGGLSTTVVQARRWSLGLGVRTTQGRDSGTEPLLSGLPDIPASLALRASARYALSPHWRLTAAWQHDVLKSQGNHLAVGAGWSQPLDGGWLLDINTGLTWADARAMNTFYGVPASASRAGRPAWSARAGWEQWGWGVGVSRALSLHWRLSGGVGHSTLLGDAARSPLIARTTGTQAQLSLAYVGW